MARTEGSGRQPLGVGERAVMVQEPLGQVAHAFTDQQEARLAQPPCISPDSAIVDQRVDDEGADSQDCSEVHRFAKWLAHRVKVTPRRPVTFLLASPNASARRQ